jgi:hypothetical protein
MKIKFVGICICTLLISSTTTLALSPFSKNEQQMKHHFCYDIMLNKTNKTGALTDPPNTPTITGKANGKIATSYDYTVQTTHPEQLHVEYFIVWGDNSTSGWIGPYESGEKVIVNHKWTEKGTYIIKVKAQDLYGAESGWGTLIVTMPYSYKPIPQLLVLLFQRFPHAFPLLRHLIGY